MTLLRNHLMLMLIYAADVALFFSFLWREERRERQRLFLVVFLSLVLGGIILGWLMYPFPIK